MASGRGYHIKVDSADVRRALDNIPEWAVPYAAASGITWTAKNIRDAEVATMRSVFDRPTRFTLNALQVVPATTKNLNGRVDFKQGFGSVPADRYLNPEVHGGGRRKKSFEKAIERAGHLEAHEFVVPGKSAKLDQSGNMRGGDLSRLLGLLQASPDPMQNATGSRRSSKVAARKSGKVFVSRGRGLPDGIYRRRGVGKALEQLIRFVGTPQYQPRFPFYDVAQTVAGLQITSNIRAAWAQISAKIGTRKR